MKHIKKVSLIIGIILIAIGCGKKENKPVKNDVVESSEPIEKEDDEQEQDQEQGETIDYDLTSMGSDMVYATVYQMMSNPNEYIGKTFRMEGIYSPVWYDPTAKYYHYCIIQDAMACCAQGMEFVWDDGSHVYPDEYPQENAKIIVTGVFETYQEDGDSNLYCRLKNATLEVEGNN